MYICQEKVILTIYGLWTTTHHHMYAAIVVRNGKAHGFVSVMRTHAAEHPHTITRVAHMPQE